MRRLLMFVMVFGAGLGARAQGVRYDNILLNVQGQPVSGANVAVCTIAANTSTKPCAPLAQIYSDRGETQPLANPTQTTGIGNYGFFASPGTYLVQIYGGQLTTGVYTVTLPCDPSASSSCGTANGLSTTSAVSTGTLSVTGNISATGTVSSSAGTAPGISGAITTGDCAKWASATTVADAGVSGCGSANAAVKPAANDAVVYVSPRGSNTNDGLSWGTAVADLYTAWNKLFVANGGQPQFVGGSGGTIYVAAGSSCGGPVTGQGLWVMGAGDTQEIENGRTGANNLVSLARSSNVVTVTLGAAPPSTYIVGAGILVNSSSDATFNGSFTIASVSGSTFTYSQTGANATVTAGFIVPKGWVPQMPVHIVGVGNNAWGGNSYSSVVNVTCGSGTASNLPGLWLSGTNRPMTFENLAITGGYQSMLLGLDSTFYTSGNRTTGANADIFRNVQFGNSNNAAGGPGVDIGASAFWIWFEKCHFQGVSAAAANSDQRQAIRLNPTSSGAGTGLVFMHDNEVDAGGIVMYAIGTNLYSLYADGITTENQSDNMAAVTIYSPFNGNFTLANITVADNTGAGFSGYGVVAQPAPGTSWGSVPDPSHVLTFNVGRTAGPVTGLANWVNASYPWPSIGPQAGFGPQGRVFGQVDDARRQFGFVSPRFTNLAATLPQNWTKDAGVTVTNATAPDGTNNAGAVTTTNTSASSAFFFDQTSFSLTAGDYLILGGWWQIPSTSLNGAAGNAPLSLQVVSCTGNKVSQLNALGAGNDSGNITGPNGEITHNWIWSAIVLKETVVGTGSCELKATGSVASANPINFYAPVLLRIAAGTIADEEAAEIAAHLESYPTSCPAGAACLLEGLPIEIGGSGDNFLAKIDHTALTANQTYTLPATGGTFSMVLTGSVAGSTTALAANSCGDAVTTTITGAITSMAVQATPQSWTATTGLVWDAWVSAANTVTLRYCNVTTGSIVPPATTFNVRGIQ